MHRRPDSVPPDIAERAKAPAPPLPVDARHAVLALQRTAGNQAVTRLLRSSAPAPQTAAAPAPQAAAAPEAAAAPALGPVGRARADVIAALDLTVARVKQAIADRDSTGRIPQAIEATLGRFFPGFKPSFLDDILARLQPMSGWVPGIDVRRVIPPATNPPHPDAIVIERVRTALVAKEPDVPAFTMIRRVVDPAVAPLSMVPGPDYVVLLPEWDADADHQATVLLHEYFHYSFIGMGHSVADPLNAAHAWQGFVSVVGELETGKQLEHLFPPRATP